MKHGGYTLEYKSWCGMIQRCFNPNNDAYARYGGAGIDRLGMQGQTIAKRIDIWNWLIELALLKIDGRRA